MLFHVTVDHSPETCPIVTNSPEKIITADLPGGIDVRSPLKRGGFSSFERPHHGDRMGWSTIGYNWVSTTFTPFAAGSARP